MVRLGTTVNVVLTILKGPTLMLVSSLVVRLPCVLTQILIRSLMLTAKLLVSMTIRGIAMTRQTLSVSSCHKPKPMSWLLRTTRFHINRLTALLTRLFHTIRPDNIGIGEWNTADFLVGSVNGALAITRPIAGTGVQNFNINPPNFYVRDVDLTALVIRFLVVTKTK